MPKTPTARRAGGAATTAGIAYQAAVAAFFAARVVAEDDAGGLPGLAPGAVPVEVACETTEALDDIAVRTSTGARLLIQAKRTLPLAKASTSEFAKACDQLVPAHLAAPPDATDSYAIVVGPDTALPARAHLRDALEVLRPQPADAPMRYAGLAKARREALQKLLAHVRRSWRAARAAAPTAGELRAFLRRVHVVVLDVEDAGADARASRELLRDTIAGPPATAWSALNRVCVDLARRQTSADRPGLVAALGLQGVAVQAPPSVRPDIERLKEETTKNLAELAELGRIELGDGAMVTIDRAAPSVLELAVGADRSLLVVGEPGIGKSGTLAELARRRAERGGDLVALRVEDVEPRSQVTLAAELRIDRPLADVLAAWPTEDGLLVIDGLDTARGAKRAAFVAAIRDVLHRAPGWRVVASIRTFDLRNDRDLKRLFAAHPGTPVPDAWREPEFAALEHLRVGRLTEDEIAQLAAEVPALHAFVTSAPQAVRDLARVPFNLRLVAELLPADVALADIDSQVGLLRAYWYERVLSPVERADARDRLLQTICRAMVDDRRLTVERPALLAAPIDLDPLNALLHEHVLVERSTAAGLADRDLLGFSHNVLFDYATARLLLRPSGAVRRMLTDDPPLLLRIRPSIELHARMLWDEGQRHEAFWAHALDLAAAPELRELARTVAPAVAAELARAPEDLEYLIEALEARPADADKIVRHVIGALVVFADAAAVVGPTSPWPWLVEQLATCITSERAWSARALVLKVLDHRDAAAPTALAHAGAAARALLQFAWASDRVDVALAEWMIEAVRQTFATDPGASEALLRRVIDPTELEARGHRQLLRLATDVDELASIAPGFVADVFRAAFTFREERTDPTVMLDSRLVGMTSNRQQDISMARYALRQAFPAFLAGAPADAIEALDAIIAAYVERRRWARGGRTTRFRLGGQTCTVRHDGSGVWLLSGANRDEEQLLATLETRLKTLAAADGGPDLYRLVAAIARGSRSTALWHVLLSVAAAYPEPFMDKIGQVLNKPALRDHPDLGHPIAALRAAVDPSAPPPAPLPVGGGYRSSAGDELDELRELGVDPDQEGNAELLALAAPIREFLERHRETAPSPADRAALRRPLQRLFDALAAGSAADDATVDSAWGWAAEAAERLTRGDLTPALLRLVREVLLAAARHQLPAAPANGNSDRFSQYGFPAPRVAAAQGLTIVATSKAELDAVARLARDAAPAVRFGVVSRLNVLAAREPEAALRIAGRRARLEESAPVLKALVHSLSRMAVQGLDGALASISAVERRERRREEPRESVLERASKELAGHAVWRDAPQGEAALRDLLRDPATDAPIVTAVLFELRDALVADDAAVRRRALAVFGAALDGAVRTLGELPDGHSETSPPDALERGRRAAEVADAVADQLYFASGVFQERQGEPPGRHADAARRARLYREAHDLLWRLASLGHPPIVHHLLELLAGCIDEDPPGVFALIAIATTSGRAHGYQHESLAIDLVVAIVERYLAQYPEVFEDNDQATALMDVLDIFVAVGWPKARRLVYRLDELYR